MSGSDSQFQQPITGTITAISQNIDLSSPNSGTEIIQIVGTWVGILIVEGSNDGTTYYPITLLNRSAKIISIGNITASGAYDANTNAFQFLRIRSTAWTSGSAVISVYGADSASLILAESVLRGGSDGSAIGNIGDALKVSGSFSIGVNDKTAFTYGTSNEQTIGGVYQDTSPSLTAGQSGAIRLTANRAQHINLRDATGVELLGQMPKANSIPVVLPTDQTLTTTSSPLPATGSGFSFGDVSTASTTKVGVYRTAYTEQTADTQMSLASSSANDTAAGTGARQVKITYLDSTGVSLNTVTITLNGTTYVNAGVTDMCFIEKMEVISVGSLGFNSGTLTLKSSTAGSGVTVGTIGSQDNQTFWAHHYIVAAKTCYISGFSISNSGIDIGMGALFTVNKKTIGANLPELQVSDFHTLGGATGTLNRTYQSPIQVIGPSRITCYVKPNSVTAATQRAAIDFIDN
jgi:hypothetical protein